MKKYTGDTSLPIRGLLLIMSAMLFVIAITVAVVYMVAFKLRQDMVAQKEISKEHTSSVKTPAIPHQIAATSQAPPEAAQGASPATRPTAPSTLSRPSPGRSAQNGGSTGTQASSGLSPYFTVGPVGSTYTSCANGVLYFNFSSTWVGSRIPTTQSFTWRLEVSDGTISQSGTSTMPAGSSIWHSFPSTADYPSALGSIIGANDGDKVRLVITSPNYAASAWSAPVPGGSEDACTNG